MLVATAPQPARPRKSAQRPGRSAICRALDAANIPGRVTVHHNGRVSITLSDPRGSDFRTRGIDPARVWAQRIIAVLPDAQVVEVRDSIAHWRPVAPVLNATVVLVFKMQNAQTAFAAQAL